MSQTEIESALTNTVLANEWERPRSSEELRALVGNFAARIGLAEYDPDFDEELN